MRLRQRFGQALAHERHKQDLTQKQLATKMKASLKHVGEIERGKANPRIDMLERAAAALAWNPWPNDEDDRREAIRLRRELKPIHHIMGFQIGLNEGLLNLTRPLVERFAKLLNLEPPPSPDATARAPQRPATRGRYRRPTAPPADTAVVVLGAKGPRAGVPRRQTPPDDQSRSPDRRVRPSRKQR